MGPGPYRSAPVAEPVRISGLSRFFGLLACALFEWHRWRPPCRLEPCRLGCVDCEFCGVPLLAVRSRDMARRGILVPARLACGVLHPSGHPPAREQAQLRFVAEPGLRRSGK